MDEVLKAAGLAEYIPKFHEYGVTTFVQATEMDETDLEDPTIGMTKYDRVKFSSTMMQIDKAMRECELRPRFRALTHDARTPLTPSNCFIDLLDCVQLKIKVGPRTRSKDSR